MQTCITSKTNSRFGCSIRRNQPSSRSLSCRVQSKLVLNPTGAGTTSHLNGESATIPTQISLVNGLYQVGRAGSGPTNITIPIPTVSSRHALIRIDGDTVSITDLGSTNGTIVNGLELAPNVETMLEVGGEVTFGDEYLARFQLCKGEGEETSVETNVPTQGTLSTNNSV